MALLGGRLWRRLAVLGMGLLAIVKLHATLAMFLSMVVSVLIYAMPFGIWYAAGFVALLLAHEGGHVLASRVAGIGAGPPLFIPFLGAVVRLERQPANAKVAANIALGGPALGTLSALACLAAYFWTGHLLLLTLAYTAALLNLFNLIPCDPLDGGQIAAAISPYAWWGGSCMIGGLFFYTYNALIFVIFLFSLTRLWNMRAKKKALYYRLSARQRLVVFWQYIALIAVLGMVTLYIGGML